MFVPSAMELCQAIIFTVTLVSFAQLFHHLLCWIVFLLYLSVPLQSFFAQYLLSTLSPVSLEYYAILALLMLSKEKTEKSGAGCRYNDMESEDYSFYKSLVFLLDNDVKEAGLDLTFSTEVWTKMS